MNLKREAQYRHAHYYRLVLESCDDDYQQGGAALSKGLSRFKADRGQIEQAQQWSANTPQDSRAAQLCAQFPKSGQFLINLRLSPHTRLAWLDAALQAAEALGLTGEQVTHLTNIGLAYNDLGDLETAVGHYNKALTLAAESNDTAVTLANLGTTLGNMGRVADAQTAHQQAAALFEQIDEPQSQAANLANLANLYADQGAFRSAIGAYEQALNVARAVNDRRGEGIYLGNMGAAYYEMGELQMSIDYFEQSLAIAREIGDRQSEGDRLGNLGNAYRSLGRPDEAAACYQEALALYRETSNRQGTGSSLNSLGTLCISQGKVKEAIVCYQEALQIARETGNRRGEGRRLGSLGGAYYKMGEYETAVTHFQQSLALARETKDRRNEYTQLASLGNAYYAKTHLETAIDYYETAVALGGELKIEDQSMLDFLGRSHRETGLAYEAMGEFDIALTHLEQALQLFEEIKSPNIEPLLEEIERVHIFI